MSSSFTLFSSIGNSILTPFLTVTAAQSALITAVQPIIIAGITINIMWHGYQTILGKGGPNAFLDVWALTLRPALVLALGVIAYTTNVTGLIDSMIGYLSGLFSTAGSLPVATGSSAAAGGTVSATLGVLDSAMSSAVSSFEHIFAIATGDTVYCAANGISPCINHITLNLLNNSPPDFSGINMIVQGFVMLVAFVIYALVAAFELLYINIALLIFYAIGPLFIAAYAFRVTEHWFSSWLKGAAQYGLTAILIATTIGIANAILQNYVTSIATNLSSMNFFLLGVSSIASAIMLLLLIYKIPELASHIVGGFSLQSSASTVAQRLDRAEQKADRAEYRENQRNLGNGGGGGGGGPGNGVPMANQIANAIVSAQARRSGTGNVTRSTRPIPAPFVGL